MGVSLRGSFVVKVAVFIDGGHLRVLAKQARYHYDPDYIEAIAHAYVAEEETLLRVLYYDCAPYQGSPKLPVSGERRNFQSADGWLKVLAAKPYIAVRLGTLKFRGFVLKRSRTTSSALSDDDFKPRFEQKGVDMRLGLDVASYAADRSVDRVILVTGDTDCLPVMKRARAAGLQIVLVQFPRQRLARELLWHSDFRREVDWPSQRLTRTHRDRRGQDRME